MLDDEFIGLHTAGPEHASRAWSAVRGDRLSVLAPSLNSWIRPEVHSDRLVIYTRRSRRSNAVGIPRPESGTRSCPLNLAQRTR